MKLSHNSIIGFLLMCACSKQVVIDQKVLQEKPSGIIVEEATKESYTGVITGIDHEGTQFKGEFKNGKPHGVFCWIKKNSDTMRIRHFKNGDRIYSSQFNSKGERSTEWIKYSPTVTALDTLLIETVLNKIKAKDFENLDRLIQGTSLDYKDLIERKLNDFISTQGELKDFILQNIDKSAYNFRSDKYLELLIDGVFEKKTMKMGMRILEDQGEIQSITMWMINNTEVDNSSITYEPFNIWALLYY